MNIYGAQLGDSTDYAKVMNSQPILGTFWKGRVLLGLSCFQKDNPEGKITGVDDEIMKEYRHIFLYFLIFSYIFLYFLIFSYIFLYFLIFSYIFLYFLIFSYIFLYFLIFSYIFLYFLIFSYIFLYFLIFSYIFLYFLIFSYIFLYFLIFSYIFLYFLIFSYIFLIINFIFRFSDPVKWKIQAEVFYGLSLPEKDEKYKVQVRWADQEINFDNAVNKYLK